MGKDDIEATSQETKFALKTCVLSVATLAHLGFSSRIVERLSNHYILYRDIISVKGAFHTQTVISSVCKIVICQK